MQGVLARIRGCCAAVLVLTSACATSVGLGAAHPSDHLGRAALTARISQQLQPQDDGPTGGVETELQTRVDPFDAGNQWRARAFGGYSNVPRSFEGAAGFSALATVGAARAYVHPAAHVYATAGARLELPIRLSETLPAWQADELIGMTWLLVPNIGVDYFIGHAHCDVYYGIALRLQTFAGVMP